MTKEMYRKKIASVISKMSASEKQDACTGVCEQLRTLASVTFADSIFSYLPLQNELSVLPAMQDWIDESRTVTVPLSNWEKHTMRAGLITSLDDDALVTTRYGIQEPVHRQLVPTDFIDIILVPGIGFDASGARLGKGGGFYDRFLENHRPRIVLGIAFDQQVVDVVPCEAHDQRMTAIVTPTRTLFH